MLVSLTTQYARAKRHAAVVLHVPVSVVEQAAAVVRAAESTKSGVVLVIDATKPMLYDLAAFVGMLLHIGRLAEAEVTVMVLTSPTHTAVEQAVAAGALVVQPERFGTLKQYLHLLDWSASRIAAHGTELVAASFELAEFDEAAEYLQGIRVAAVEVPTTVSPHLFPELSHKFRMPVLIRETANHTPTRLQKFKTKGVSGILLLQEFDEAFTAGARVGIRQRDESNPVTYLQKASRATEDKAVSYFKFLCTT